MGNEPQTKQCSQCGRFFTLDQFRRHRFGLHGKASQCRKCHNRAERLRRDRRRLRVFALYARQASRETSFRRLEAETTAIVRRYGGSLRFAVYWRDALHQAQANRPHGKLAGEMLLTVANVVRMAAQPRIEAAILAAENSIIAP